MTDPPEITDVQTLKSYDTGQRAIDRVAYRLVELQCSPICGGFDTAHLQNIHHYLFQDIYEGAGELRTDDIRAESAAGLEQSLDAILDGLASENHLRGLSPDDWNSRASQYLYDIGSLQPFEVGNAVTLREFASELARKNHLALSWDRAPGIADEESFVLFQQQAQTINLRRLIMLSLDEQPDLCRPTRGERQRGVERFMPIVDSIL